MLLYYYSVPICIPIKQLKTNFSFITQTTMCGSCSNRTRGEHLNAKVENTTLDKKAWYKTKTVPMETTDAIFDLVKLLSTYKNNYVMFS